MITGGISGPTRRQLAGFLAICVLASLLGGCATSQVSKEAPPAHPFPQWVSELVPGETDREAIRARFGEPDQRELRTRGGSVWRYSFLEVHDFAADSARPAVSTEAGEAQAEPSPLERAKDGTARALRWVSGWVFYPPSQPRPPRTRVLPATIHDLELVIEADGTLRSVRYTPEAGRTRVRADG